MKVTIQKAVNVPTPTRAHDTDASLDQYIPEGHGCPAALAPRTRPTWDQYQADRYGTPVVVIS